MARANALQRITNGVPAQACRHYRQRRNKNKLKTLPNMELEKLKRANEIQQTTAYLKEHLNLRSISEDATKIYFDSRGRHQAEVSFNNGGTATVRLTDLRIIDSGQSNNRGHQGQGQNAVHGFYLSWFNENNHSFARGQKLCLKTYIRLNTL